MNTPQAYDELYGALDTTRQDFEFGMKVMQDEIDDIQLNIGKWSWVLYTDSTGLKPEVIDLQVAMDTQDVVTFLLYDGSSSYAATTLLSSILDQAMLEGGSLDLGHGVSITYGSEPAAKFHIPVTYTGDYYIKSITITDFTHISTT